MLLLPLPPYILDKRICTFPLHHLPPSHPSHLLTHLLFTLLRSSCLPAYPSFCARTTIWSADVSPSWIASEKIGLAPAPQLPGPAMLQSRELVASSWHGLGRFRVNFIRGLVAVLHRVLIWNLCAMPPMISQITLQLESYLILSLFSIDFCLNFNRIKLTYREISFKL